MLNPWKCLSFQICSEAEHLESVYLFRFFLTLFSCFCGANNLWYHIWEAISDCSHPCSSWMLGILAATCMCDNLIVQINVFSSKCHWALKMAVMWTSCIRMWYSFEPQFCSELWCVYNFPSIHFKMLANMTPLSVTIPLSPPPPPPTPLFFSFNFNINYNWFRVLYDNIQLT